METSDFINHLVVYDRVIHSGDCIDHFVENVLVKRTYTDTNFSYYYFYSKHLHLYTKIVNHNINYIMYWDIATSASLPSTPELELLFKDCV